MTSWHTVYQQTQRWLKARVFEAMVQDLREILRILAGRDEQPSAVILDSRTLQSIGESGHRAGYDGGKRKKGSKVHIAVDLLEHLLALHVTVCQRARPSAGAELAQPVQQITEESVKVAFVDQGYTGAQATADAEAGGIRLEGVKLLEAQKGFVLLPQRWVIERSFD